MGIWPRIDSGIVQIHQSAFAVCRLEQIAYAHRLRILRSGAQAAARITVEAAPLTAVGPFEVSIIFVERTARAQRGEQYRLILGAHLGIERMTSGGLGKQLCDVAIVVRLNGSQPLRLAAEGLATM